MNKNRKGFTICVVAVIAIFTGLFFYHLKVVNPYKEGKFGEGKFGLPEGVYVKLNPISNVLTFHVNAGNVTDLGRAFATAKMFASSTGRPMFMAIYEKLSKDENDLYARIISYSVNDEPKIDL